MNGAIATGIALATALMTLVTVTGITWGAHWHIAIAQRMMQNVLADLAMAI